jgi:ABC-type dipeptide/oligopeptide/nickel transport system permease component
MLQLLSRRIVFILVVCLCIALFIHLGMRMVRNSEIREPNYDLVTQTRLAWEDTRRYLRGALQGDLGSIRVGPQTAPISQVLKESYVNSMGLLLVALIAAVLIGLPLGLLASAVKRRNPDRNHSGHFGSCFFCLPVAPARRIVLRARFWPPAG